MRILVLDDDQYRLAVFKMRFNNETVTLAKTANEAIIALASKAKFNCAFLDHDLGPKSKDGLAVARYITEMEHNKQPSLVVIHSHNHYRASEMALALTEAGVKSQIAPFALSPSERAMMTRYDSFVEERST